MHPPSILSADPIANHICYQNHQMNDCLNCKLIKHSFVMKTLRSLNAQNCFSFIYISNHASNHNMIEHSSIKIPQAD